MKVYLVGGAVRDQLLGLPIVEKDWVVVGATEEEMLRLGYRRVGKEFPVFLHPQSKEEYALARQERKIAKGYKGFEVNASPAVALHDDLMRRDLTINAMAWDESTHSLIDPFHGKNDIEQKKLRHVSPAFAEDPVRILRVARFYARYGHLGFEIEAETLHLMKEMVRHGEVNALVAERVWKEWSRALSEPNPENFFIALESCGALALLFPHLHLDNLGMAALIASTKISKVALVRFAALLFDLPTPEHTITALCHRYHVPNDYYYLARLSAVHSEQALSLSTSLSTPSVLLKHYQQLDALRREERYHLFLEVVQAIAEAKKTRFEPTFLMQGLGILKKIDVKILINQGKSGKSLAAAIEQNRLHALSEYLGS